MRLADGHEVELRGPVIPTESLSIGDFFIAGREGSCLLVYLGDGFFFAEASGRKYRVVELTSMAQPVSVVWFPHFNHAGMFCGAGI